MGLINAKPRFALDVATNQLYDYEAKDYVPTTGKLGENGGAWDLAKVADLIRTGQGISTAFIPGETGDLTDKVKQADADFAKAIDDEAAKHAANKPWKKKKWKEQQPAAAATETAPAPASDPPA